MLHLSTQCRTAVNERDSQTIAKKFQNKYRIYSTRQQNWGYRWAGAYFIAICTKNRWHYFGEIQHGKMNLSNAGELANV